MLDEELRALGTVFVLEGSTADFPLALDSLDHWSRHREKRPQWMLLSVLPASDTTPERAQVWVSDEYRATFLKLFEDYRTVVLATGKSKNATLMANINAIRSAVLRDLWQSTGEPQQQGTRWWEVWLRATPDGLDLLRAYAAKLGLEVSARVLELPSRTVTWIYADWGVLQPLPFTGVPLAEIRRPEFADSVADLPRDDQATLVGDLAERIAPAPDAAPAVCHLDSGVLRAHLLLAASLSTTDVYSVVGDTADARRHGTKMAGLSLLGDLAPHLLSSDTVVLRHRLESVKILPDPGTQGHDPLAYGVVTAQAVALPEATARRPRVFCLTVTAAPDARPGVPTLWSASVDALAAGVDITRDGDSLQLLGAPDAAASRLFVVCTGNAGPVPDGTGHLDWCDTEAAQDPAQAWNALTVGAFTERTGVPSDPAFTGWSSVAKLGELSPYSRTSVAFATSWPIKPDFCMEGGNVLVDGRGDSADCHPAVSLTTTDAGGDELLASANATSAATAQAARLAAMAMAQYPSYWPETVRALLVHGARWTPPMAQRVTSARTKAAKRALLARYGWGVPTEESVLSSTTRAVTLVVQDEFTPFVGADHKARAFRLHELPWPTEVLQDLGDAPVTMRVTLSYFIEPAASRRGWRKKYSYASHGLRFTLKASQETPGDFIARINRRAAEEEGGVRPSSESDRWLLGEKRDVGSLHQDVWEGGTGPDLARCGVLAVHPVGGWWKYNTRRDRAYRPVRYALIISLSTEAQGVDLYTPIANELRIPVTAT